MKDSAVIHEAKPQDDDTSAFQRFAKTMRALVAVPKRELAEKLGEEKVRPSVKSRSASLTSATQRKKKA